MLPTSGHRPAHSGAKAVIPHEVRTMVTTWHGRNLQLAGEHDLLTLAKRLNGAAKHLPHSYGAQRLQLNCHAELERRGLPTSTSTESSL